jgi:hypothetical protein
MTYIAAALALSIFALLWALKKTMDEWEDDFRGRE